MLWLREIDEDAIVMPWQAFFADSISPIVVNCNLLQIITGRFTRGNDKLLFSEYAHHSRQAILMLI